MSVLEPLLYETHPHTTLCKHAVGDPPTRLELHVNSPGYRLILNNVLFPAARKKEQKT